MKSRVNANDWSINFEKHLNSARGAGHNTWFNQNYLQKSNDSASKEIFPTSLNFHTCGLGGKSIAKNQKGTPGKRVVPRGWSCSTVSITFWILTWYTHGGPDFTWKQPANRLRCKPTKVHTHTHTQLAGGDCMDRVLSKKFCQQLKFQTGGLESHDAQEST